MELLLTVLDKYGPLGAALLILSYALRLIVLKVLPGIIETQGRRLDAQNETMKDIAGAVSRLVDTVGTKDSDHEQRAVGRHGEVLGGLGEIKQQAARIITHLETKQSCSGKSCLPSPSSPPSP